MSVGVCEVTTHHHKNLITLIDVELLINPSSEKFNFLISGKSFKGGVCDNR